MPSFEDQFFARVASPQGAVHLAGIEPIRFTTAKSRFRTAKVDRSATGGYRIAGVPLRSHVAFSRSLLADNTIDLHFSEDMVDYKPEDGLINKSKLPLWVIQSGVDGTLAIERVWSK
jgi:hypothetical protein